MKIVRFEKWEGLGNDFVVMDASVAPFALLREHASRLCDRRLGVGADGILLVDRRVVANEPARMIVLNADGSRPEMCGNGLRCVAASLCVPGSEPEFMVLTDDGLRACEVERGEAEFRVSIDMGEVRFPGGTGKPGVQRSDVLGDGYVVDAGNPHWIFLEAPAGVQLSAVGPMHENDARFPARTNVEVLRKEAAGVWRVEVWERGVGLTQACGTGAVAVAGLLVALGHEDPGVPLDVRLPGGSLQLTVDAVTRRVKMRGPARRVYAGELDAAAFPELWGGHGTSDRF